MLLFLGVGAGLGCGAAATAVRVPEASVETGWVALDELAGSAWRWTEARCVDGASHVEGLRQTLRVQRDGDAFWLVYDQVQGECSRTVIQRTSSSGPTAVEEIARVALPSSDECIGEREPRRPAEFRWIRGEAVELELERSRICDGFGVTLRFVPMSATPLDGAELARHYAAYFSLGDASRVAELFAASGSLLEPFTATPTGDPFRHDGRSAVYRFHQSIFDESSWRGLRIIAFAQETSPPVSLVGFEYMDADLSTPLRGRLRFVSGAGEIFEEEIQVLEAPLSVGDPDTSSTLPAASASSDTRASGSASRRRGEAR